MLLRCVLWIHIHSTHSCLHGYSIPDIKHNFACLHQSPWTTIIAKEFTVFNQWRRNTHLLILFDQHDRDARIQHGHGDSGAHGSCTNHSAAWDSCSPVLLVIGTTRQLPLWTESTNSCCSYITCFNKKNDNNKSQPSFILRSLYVFFENLEVCI